MIRSWREQLRLRQTGIEEVALALTAAAAVGGVATSVVQAKQENEAASAQVQAEKRAAQARTDERLQAIRDLRGSQRVAAASAGVSLASPSFEAIQADNESRLKAAQSADDIRSAYEYAGLKSRAKNAGTFGIADSLISGLGDVGGSLALYKYRNRPAN